MSHNYSTALSHLVLSGIGICCLILTHNHFNTWTFGQTSFLIMSVNSLVGLWRWGNPDYGKYLTKLYRFTSYLQLYCGLPLITIELWYNYDYQKEVIYVHTVCSLVPLTLFMASIINDDLNDLVLSANILSLGTISFLEANYWGIAAAVSYGFSYYCVTQMNSLFEIPITDLFNYALCFFTYFSMKAMME